MNYFKTVALMSLLMGLCLLIGHMLGGITGMVLGFVLAAAMNFGAYWFSDRMLLAMHRAREVTESREPGLFAAVRRMTAAAGLPAPRVFVIEEPAPNAFATGRDPKHSAVAVTRGLLELLPADELEAVIAHEVAHIRNRDMLIGTLAATLAGAIMVVATMARYAALFGGFSRDDDEEGGGLLGFLLLAVLAPLAATVVQLAISRSQEYSADARAAQLNGNPLALARALRRIESAAGAVPPAAASPAAAHLYIMNPFRRGGFLVNLFSTHPPVERRVARLASAAGERA